MNVLLKRCRIVNWLVHQNDNDLEENVISFFFKSMHVLSSSKRAKKEKKVEI